MSYFDIFRDSKKKEYTENDISEKYTKFSTRCAVLKWLSLTVLVVYVIMSVSMHGDELSLDSIRYIVRYMKDSPVSLVSNGDSINFDYDVLNKAYVIGDDFAVVGKNNITVYDFSGKILFTDNFIYENPMAVSNGNELIVYNIGGKEIRFYNSFSLTERLTFDSPIYNVSVSKEGNYLFQTASEGYRTGFQVYDKNKSLIFKNNFGELTLQTSSISFDGKNIATASFSTTENKISSLLYLYDITKNKPIHEFKIIGEYPVSVQFVDEDSIVLFTDKSVRFFNIDLENTFSYLYGDRMPLSFKVTEGNVVLTYNNSLLSENTEIEIFRNNGAEKNIFSVNTTVIDLYCGKDFLHILQSDCVKTYSLDENNLISEHPISNSYFGIVKINDEKYLLSRSDKIEIFINE